jgi:hypothetical protein
VAAKRDVAAIGKVQLLIVATFHLGHLKAIQIQIEHSGALVL